MSFQLSVYRESEGEDVFSQGVEEDEGAAAARGEHRAVALCCVPCAAQLDVHLGKSYCLQDSGGNLTI